MVLHCYHDMQTTTCITMFSVLSMTFKYFKVKIMFYNFTYYLCHHN